LRMVKPVLARSRIGLDALRDEVHRISDLVSRDERAAET
jgi:hypothetical protein